MQFKPEMFCRALPGCSQGVLRGELQTRDFVSGDACALVTACSLELIHFSNQSALFSGLYRAVYENSFCSNRPDLPDNKA